MKTATEKLRRQSYNSNKTFAHVNPCVIAQQEEEAPPIGCVDCLRYWSLNFIVNGIFTTSRIVGYSQFMVFMILRVIITGSLCGRLFGDDPTTMNCSYATNGSSPDAQDISVTSANSKISNNYTSLLDRVISEDVRASMVEILSHEVAITCLNAAYGNVSPLLLWAISLLTVILPWLLLLPWTPLRDEQDFIECKPTSYQWPCLTIYVVRFFRACVRFLLQFLFLVSVPVLYGTGIRKSVKCYQNTVECEILDAEQKTYFLWLFVAVNLISCCLTAWELIDICNNKHFYETERGGYSSAKLNSNRSSTAAMWNSANNKNPSHIERGRVKVRLNGPELANKRRVGTNRSSVTKVKPKKSKFRARITRQADGDAIINLALHKDDAKNGTFPRWSTAEEMAGGLGSKINSAVTSPTDVIVHESRVKDACTANAAFVVAGQPNSL